MPLQLFQVLYVKNAILLMRIPSTNVPLLKMLRNACLLVASRSYATHVKRSLSC